MAIYRLIKNSQFRPEETNAMTDAYERALVDIGITDTSDPRTENIAVAILHLFRNGETDPEQLAKFACRAVRWTPGAKDGQPG